jgi:hypothetical protein
MSLDQHTPCAHCGRPLSHCQERKADDGTACCRACATADLHDPALTIEDVDPLGVKIP